MYGMYIFEKGSVSNDMQISTYVHNFLFVCFSLRKRKRKNTQKGCENMMILEKLYTYTYTSMYII